MSERTAKRLQNATLVVLIASATLRIAAASPRPQPVPKGGQQAAASAPLAQDAAASQSWAGKVAPAILARAVATNGQVDFLIAFHRPDEAEPPAARPGAPARLLWIAETGDGLERDYTSAGVQVLQRYSHLAAVYASAPASALALLAADPRVEAIAVNHHVRKVDTSGRALMHVAAIQPPYNGAGIGIALLDSGVDYTHAELAPLGTKTIALYDAFRSVGDPSYAKDDDGHGTEVAGIAAGTGVNPSAIGVAPAATIISVKILDSSGNGNDSQILSGINAILASISGGNPYNIRVANFSLGGYENTNGASGVPQQPCDPEGLPLVDAFQQLINANVVPVVAAGNGGCTNGVSWPACISTSLAAGAVFTSSIQGSYNFPDKQQCNGDKGCSQDISAAGQVACYSDSGAKLDVWAPSHCANTSKMGGGYDDCFGGTSASAAYTSGVVALVTQAQPSATASAISAAVRNNGQPITDSRNGITRNLVLADSAIAQVQCTTPNAPGNVATNESSVCSGQQFVMSWGAVSGATSYTVQVATDASFTAPTSSNTTSTSFTYSTTQASAATLYLRVEAANSCGTTSNWSTAVQVTYTPTCQTSFASSYYVSGVARTPGYAPAYWYSDLSVLNATTTPANLRVTFYGTTFPPAYTLTLGAHQQITWPDVLGTLFGVTQDKGMIVVESDQQVLAMSRTYSQVASPTTVQTFGQAYVGMLAGQALPNGKVGYLASLRSDGQFRTNLEFLNASQVPTDVEVRFFSGAGTQIGTMTVSVPPNRWVQKTLALSAGQSSAFAEVRTLAPGASVISFATVVDGNSTDPTGIALWIP
jgi:subtilisin family serine protease